MEVLWEVKCAFHGADVYAFRTILGRNRTKSMHQHAAFALQAAMNGGEHADALHKWVHSLTRVGGNDSFSAMSMFTPPALAGPRRVYAWELAGDIPGSQIDWVGDDHFEDYDIENVYGTIDLDVLPQIPTEALDGLVNGARLESGSVSAQHIGSVDARVVSGTVPAERLPSASIRGEHIASVSVQALTGCPPRGSETAMDLADMCGSVIEQHLPDHSITLHGAGVCSWSNAYGVLDTGRFLRQGALNAQHICQIDADCLVASVGRGLQGRLLARHSVHSWALGAVPAAAVCGYATLRAVSASSALRALSMTVESASVWSAQILKLDAGFLHCASATFAKSIRLRSVHSGNVRCRSACAGYVHASVAKAMTCSAHEVRASHAALMKVACRRAESDAYTCQQLELESVDTRTLDCQQSCVSAVISRRLHCMNAVSARLDGHSITTLNALAATLTANQTHGSEMTCTSTRSERVAACTVSGAELHAGTCAARAVMAGGLNAYGAAYCSNARAGSVSISDSCVKAETLRSNGASANRIQCQSACATKCSGDHAHALLAKVSSVSGKSVHARQLNGTSASCRLGVVAYASTHTASARRCTADKLCGQTVKCMQASLQRAHAGMLATKDARTERIVLASASAEKMFCTHVAAERCICNHAAALRGRSRTLVAHRVKVPSISVQKLPKSFTQRLNLLISAVNAATG